MKTEAGRVSIALSAVATRIPAPRDARVGTSTVDHGVWRVTMIEIRSRSCGFGSLFSMSCGTTMDLNTV